MGNISVIVNNEEELHQALGTPHADWIEFHYLPSKLGQLREKTNAKLVYHLQSDHIHSLTGLYDIISVFDFIDITINHGDLEFYLAEIPIEKRIITSVEKVTPEQSIQEQVAPLFLLPATYYRVVVEAEQTGDEIEAIRLLLDSDKTNLIAYGLGEEAIWTHMLSGVLGSSIVPSGYNAKQYLPPNRVATEYHAITKNELKKLYGIVGNPVYSSISPKLHNQAYKKLGLPYLYLPFHATDFSKFQSCVIEPLNALIPVEGLTVVSPFKEDNYQLAKACFDPDVHLSKGANLMMNHAESGWTAHTTDAIGAIEALTLLDKSWETKAIAVIGCGGAGKTIAARLSKLDVNLNIVNRSVEVGASFAKEIEVPFVSLKDFEPSNYDIIIHCTPLGRNGESPFELAGIKQGTKVIDLVYALYQDTPLVAHCKMLNNDVIDGKQIASIQIAQQFKYMTGLDMAEGEVSTVQHDKINK